MIRNLARSLGLVLLLSGCVAFDLATREPPRLYSLTPKSNFDPGMPEVEATVTVEQPTATAGLNTSRIALRPTPTSLDFYAGASWIDVLPIMIQNLLVESFDNTAKIDVLARDIIGIRADYAVLIHVREFQADYPRDPRVVSDVMPTVNVRLQARVLRLPRRETVATSSFSRRVESESGSMESIIRAFDEGLGGTMQSLVQWTAEVIVEDERPAG